MRSAPEGRLPPTSMRIIRWRIRCVISMWGNKSGPLPSGRQSWLPLPRCCSVQSVSHAWYTYRNLPRGTSSPSAASTPTDDLILPRQSPTPAPAFSLPLPTGGTHRGEHWDKATAPFPLLDSPPGPCSRTARWAMSARTRKVLDPWIHHTLARADSRMRTTPKDPRIKPFVTPLPQHRKVV